jgi:peptidoglycan/xylan/chitin deacetylase (PgdA/CDA1 family)
MNWSIWHEVEKTLNAQNIKPILAVIPDNRDENLRVSAPNLHFWERVREWQSRGWTIAMHGWQHRFVTAHSGILKVQPYSEFAGLSFAEQEFKLRSGLAVFNRNGVKSKLWVAPAHSFDVATIWLLLDLGFLYLSDGFFMLPHVDTFGMTWIPQQLWSLKRRPFGVWTACFHVNGWTRDDLRSFEQDAALYRDAISSFDAVIEQYAGRKETIFDSISASLYRAAAKTKAAIGDLPKGINPSQVTPARKGAA